MLDGLSEAAPELKVTADPVENRGFEYHTGISFTLFAATPRPVGELGRGGRYQAGDPAEPEPATGFTLYTDTILRTLPPAASPRRLLLPFGDADGLLSRELRESGWITVAALDTAVDWRAGRHAARLRLCSRTGCAGGGRVEEVLDGQRRRCRCPMG